MVVALSLNLTCPELWSSLSFHVNLKQPEVLDSNVCTGRAEVVALYFTG